MAKFISMKQKMGEYKLEDEKTKQVKEGEYHNFYLHYIDDAETSGENFIDTTPYESFIGKIKATDISGVFGFDVTTSEQFNGWFLKDIDKDQNMMYNKTNKANNKKECAYMDNEVKEILMQLVDTTNKLAEGQKETNKRLDNIENDITDIKKDIFDMKEDITELKRESKITRVNVNHNGEVLEQMVKDLAPLNMLCCISPSGQLHVLAACP